MTFQSLARELILREKRRGNDMNITHATGLLRQIFDIAHEKPFEFFILMCKECIKRKRRKKK